MLCWNIKTDIQFSRWEDFSLFCNKRKYDFVWFHAIKTKNEEFKCNFANGINWKIEFKSLWFFVREKKTCFAFFMWFQKWDSSCWIFYRIFFTFGEMVFKFKVVWNFCFYFKTDFDEEYKSVVNILYSIKV